MEHRVHTLKPSCPLESAARTSRVRASTTQWTWQGSGVLREGGDVSGREGDHRAHYCTPHDSNPEGFTR
jgi:hypothetical protein